MKAFRERAQEVGICFATLESMHPNADEAKFDDLIAAVQKHPRARVIVCMCEGRTVGMLFDAFKRHKVPDRYLVVGGSVQQTNKQTYNSKFILNRYITNNKQMILITIKFASKM